MPFVLRMVTFGLTLSDRIATHRTSCGAITRPNSTNIQLLALDLPPRLIAGSTLWHVLLAHPHRQTLTVSQVSHRSAYFTNGMPMRLSVILFSIAQK